jgi:hypothetical protein
MGEKHSKSSPIQIKSPNLSEEDISKLVKSTNFDRSKILLYYSKFIVS